MSALGKLSETFWSENPCNARNGDRRLTDTEYFAQIRAKKNRAEPHCLDFLAPHTLAGKHVLDVGCGIGTQSVWAAQAGAIVRATDFSMESLSLALRHAAAAGVSETMSVRMQDWEQSYFSPYAYDLIWAWGTLHHMRDPLRVLKGLRNHCASTGTVLKIMLYHENSTKVWRLKAIHGRDWREWTEANGPVPISNAYSLGQACHLVEAGGWRIDRAFIAHLFPWNWRAYRRGEWKLGFPWNLTTPKMRETVARKWGFHVLIQARPA